VCWGSALVAETIQRYAVGAIMHFADSIVVPDSMTQPLVYYRNNTVNSHALIEACIATSPRPMCWRYAI
jgi:UDP-glucose 4-epimerase